MMRVIIIGFIVGLTIGYCAWAYYHTRRKLEDQRRRRIAREEAMARLAEERRLAAQQAHELAMQKIGDPYMFDTADPPADDTCAECGALYAMNDDYLCPDCRAKMDA